MTRPDCIGDTTLADDQAIELVHVDQHHPQRGVPPTPPQSNQSSASGAATMINKPATKDPV
jgi:hypothetical protein